MTKKDIFDKIQFTNVSSDKEKVYATIWDKIDVKNSKLISPIWKYISIAASIALFIISYISVIEGLSYQKIAYMEVHNIRGSKTRVVLPDSSIVWLGGNTILRYPNHFENHARNISITGNGDSFFEVKKDKEAPFTVEAEAVKIKVLGTVFNIHIENNKHKIETTLLKGKIAITNKIQNKSYILDPDMQAVYTKGESEFALRKVEATLYGSWITGKMIFENKNLKDIVDFVSRAYGTPVIIKDQELGESKYSAVFEQDESIDQILFVLQLTGHFHFTKAKEGYIIHK